MPRGRSMQLTDLNQAIMMGAVERVRPKMMTVIAIMAGLLPIMWNTGAGSEVMQRIAVPMKSPPLSTTLDRKISRCRTKIWVFVKLSG